MRQLLLLAGVFLLVLVLSGCGGSKETFKQAQAAVVKPYAALLNVIANSYSTAGADATAAEEKRTEQLIAAVQRHRPALGLHEAKRALSDTAYALHKLGDVCPPCQEKLTAAAQAMT